MENHYNLQISFCTFCSHLFTKNNNFTVLLHLEKYIIMILNYYLSKILGLKRSECWQNSIYLWQSWWHPAPSPSLSWYPFLPAVLDTPFVPSSWSKIAACSDSGSDRGRLSRTLGGRRGPFRSDKQRLLISKDRALVVSAQVTCFADWRRRATMAEAGVNTKQVRPLTALARPNSQRVLCRKCPWLRSSSMRHELSLA